MKNSLKKQLQEIVDESVKNLNSLKPSQPPPKRIVVYTSNRSFHEGNVVEILNYTENLFLNSPLKARMQIKVIPAYNRQRDGREGDYSVDVGVCLGL